MKNYYKAVRIAKSYAGPWYRDIVHSAYITYWNKFESNLFDEHEGTVLRYVKNQYGNFYRTYYKNLRSNIHISAIEDHQAILITTPLDEVIGWERLRGYNDILDGCSGNTRSVLELKLAGYKDLEIQKELGVTRGFVRLQTKTKLNNFKNG